MNTKGEPGEEERLFVDIAMPMLMPMSMLRKLMLSLKAVLTWRILHQSDSLASSEKRLLTVNLAGVVSVGLFCVGILALKDVGILDEWTERCRCFILDEWTERCQYFSAEL